MEKANERSWEDVQWPRHGGNWGTSWQKLSKKNGIKLVGYTFRLKNYVKILPISLGLLRAGAATEEVRYAIRDTVFFYFV